MLSPYRKYNADIKQLIGEGCLPNEVTQQLLEKYPKLVCEAAEILKHVQKIEREFRQSDS